jgi:ABC-type phosphate transport system permease subunit
LESEESTSAEENGLKEKTRSIETVAQSFALWRLATHLNMLFSLFVHSWKVLQELAWKKGLSH